jgi:hypothetical protein
MKKLPLGVVNAVRRLKRGWILYQTWNGWSLANASTTMKLHSATVNALFNRGLLVSTRSKGGYKLNESEVPS